MKPLLLEDIRPARIVWHNGHFLFHHAGYFFFKRSHSFFHAAPTCSITGGAGPARTRAAAIALFAVSHRGKQFRFFLGCNFIRLVHRAVGLRTYQVSARIFRLV